MRLQYLSLVNGKWGVPRSSDHRARQMPRTLNPRVDPDNARHHTAVYRSPCILVTTFSYNGSRNCELYLSSIVVLTPRCKRSASCTTANITTETSDVPKPIKVAAGSNIITHTFSATDVK
ncbi:hypothetical protein INT43_002976 [Umbelopsis isabellina]|uniref:Uncharacterized protein n=1 Tax=Mortierella isabellina TaxID=91625 RepID=A0A8H7U9D8_MORIS|nr:hypothetical protein INT43_002976 [Umbelopsis isabellina]